MSTRLEKVLGNPRMVALAIALVLVAGLGALQNLPRIEDPYMTNRHGTVLVQFPGASAERVEALVIEPLEQALREIPEIDHLTATARAGVASLVIELEDSVQSDESEALWSEARDKIRQARSQLPEGVSEPVLDNDRSYPFTWIAALQWQGDEIDIDRLNRHANELASRMVNTHGTAQVKIFGQPQEEVRVDIDPVKIASLGLDASAVSQRIADVDAKVAAGELHNDNHRMSLEVTGAFSRIEDIRRLPLVTEDSGISLQLGDVAKVYRHEIDPARSYAFVDGERAVVVAVRMLFDVRGDYWTEDIRQVAEDFRAGLPSEVSLNELFVQERYNEIRLGDLMESITIGFLLILGVLWVTLGWRSAIIVAAALPLTTLFSLACMRLIELPIHQMSVTGLIVALGIMVDNAIVVTDTVMRYRREGIGVVSAAARTFRHLWVPLLGSTLTTVLAFMPMVLMPGPAGEFIGGISLAVIGSLIGSWLISLFIIAPLAGRWLSPTQSHGLELPVLGRIFSRTLGWVLRAPRLTMLLIFVLPVLGFIQGAKLPEQFFPVSDRDMLNMELYLPASAGIESTLEATRRLSDVMNKQEDIIGLNWFVGSSAPSFYYNLKQGKDGAQNYAQAMITTTDYRAANRLVSVLQREIDSAFPEYQALVRRLEQGPPADAPVELRLMGSSVEQLKDVGEKLRRIALATEDVVHVRDSLSEVVPKVWLQVDPVKTRVGGAAPTDLSAKLQADLNGIQRGSLLEATEQLPVRVRVEGISAVAVDELDLLPMNLAKGPRPLMAIADTELRPAQAQITRRDGQRVNKVEVYIRDGVLPSVVLGRLRQAMDSEGFALPAGVQIQIGGESENRDKALSKLLSSVSLIVVLMVVAVLMAFNSLRFTLVIFVVAGQAAGLGMLSLSFSGFPFGFTSIVALMGLIGLAVNAAIIILTELKANPRAMAADREAIIASVGECTRHITSTTITTVAGLLPLILGGGGFWPPFAIVLAGGTVLATILSLYFVPAAFLVLRKPFLLTLLQRNSNADKRETDEEQQALVVNQ
jgi:multidrug efflux pump subunit AcrB